MLLSSTPRSPSPAVSSPFSTPASIPSLKIGLHQYHFSRSCLYVLICCLFVFLFLDISLVCKIEALGSATSLQLTQMMMFTFDSHWNSFAFIGRSLGQRWARLSPAMKHPEMDRAFLNETALSLALVTKLVTHRCQNSRRLRGCLCGQVSGPECGLCSGVDPLAPISLGVLQSKWVCVCVFQKG